MSEFFLHIVNMSISAGWVVLAVLVLRLILKKAPKWITVLLWGIVAVRLICPFSIESAMSLIPSAETINPEISVGTPEINTGVSIIDNTLNPIITDSTVTVEPEKSVNALKLIIPILAMLWVVGIVAFLIYTVVSFVQLRKKIGAAVLCRDNIFQSENVVSPFVLGIIKPKIYLPFNIEDNDMEHVIAHERAHIRRNDHLWKPLGFLLLAIHWFNPLMWTAYILLCRDIELACDEKVVKELNSEQRADYSQALLSCSVNRRMIAACPIAFGEVGVKNRVKSVLNYKKPAFWIVLVSIVLIIVVAVCFLTNPKNPINSLDDELAVFIEGEIYAHHYSSGHTDENFAIADLDVLKVKKSSLGTTVYGWVLYMEYSYNNGELKEEAGAHIPTVITVKESDSGGRYELAEYWEPRDGSYYAKDIRAKFPWYLYLKAIDSQRNIDEQEAKCLKAAKEYFSTVSNVGGADAPSRIITYAEVEQLKARFPMYFDLNTSKGLEIYIWQMSENSYYCALLSGENQIYTREELWNLHKNAATMEEMRIIVASYADITRSNVAIRPVAMPHSSYIYKIDEVYQKKITNMFWSQFPTILATSYSSTIDTASFDIDGDGKEEQCYLSYGPTSGLFTFIFSAYESGELKYFNIFNSWHNVDLSFEKDKKGNTVLMGKNGDNSQSMALSVVDGNISISGNEGISYWGEQGFNSPHAPKSERKIDKAISDVLKKKYDKKNDEFVYIQSYYTLEEESTPIVDKGNRYEERTVYLIVFYMKYRITDIIEEVEGDFVPTAITFAVDDNGEYALKDYWTPSKGKEYENDIKSRFPKETAEEALNIEKYAKVLTDNSWIQASKYLNK